MKVTFLGTGAAEGVPAVFCDCSTCKKVRARGKKEFHTRAQFLVDESLCIDFPPDGYFHSLRHGVDNRKICSVLVTHSHLDHFYPNDFMLRGYKYASPIDTPLTVYGNEEVAEVFAESVRREIKPDVKATLKMQTVKAFEPFLTADGYLVTPLVANHGKTPTFVYLVEKGEQGYLHLTDTGLLPQATIDFLEKYYADKSDKVGLVTFDCTFVFGKGGENARHMGLEDNAYLQRLFLEKGICSAQTKYAITHYSHNSAPLKENLKKAAKGYGYIPTFDGTVIKF